MTTKNLEQGQPAPLDPNVEASTGGQEGTQEAVDWQARAQEALAENEKLENALRSERGRQDGRITEIAEDMGAFRAQLKALANRTASGETESLSQDFAKIDQDSATRQASRNWDNNYKEAEYSLADAIMDDNQNTLLDDDAISDLRVQWQEAQGKGDLHGLYRVVSQAGKMARAVEKQKALANVEQVSEEAKVAQKASNTKHGVHDLSISTPSGIGGGKSRAQIESATSTDDISDEDYASYVSGA